MSLYSKLFGGIEKSKPDPLSFKGFEIFPDLMAEGSKYRLLARIEKTIDGDRKTHTLISAKAFLSRQAGSLKLDLRSGTLYERHLARPLGMLLHSRLNGRLRLSLVNHLLGKGDFVQQFIRPVGLLAAAAKRRKRGKRTFA
ncbi:HlyU family transcriptional regulator [Ruegeria sp. 6PALISEP08]|uniref:HlyU family transcriptional regulator n=1 Tax=Ruegeria sp. 6PALISEP08 TaxID=1225660 RepID=UPI000ADB126A|nr:HlyU family transcriptional regulator [Ruegeria sp. 6PALISEP08]